jgi:holo-ACP synthase/triphosphoribosyl-dephospho-CoA synthase
VLRKIGMDGETRMLKATGGVNTQKGLLFSLGIVAAAVGWTHNNNVVLGSAEILNCVSVMSKGLVDRELGNLAKPEAKLTAGERLFRLYGVTGIRGEMERGLPAVLEQGLPTLRQSMRDGLGVNHSLLQTLLVLMTVVDDTTVMNRHHPDKMRVWAKGKAEQALAAGGLYTRRGQDLIAAMDWEFIEHNVSPGGVADLLSVTWFLYRLEIRGQA